MKRIVPLICVLAFIAATAFAGGDQNCCRHRGDKGQGEVHQHQAPFND